MAVASRFEPTSAELPAPHGSAWICGNTPQASTYSTLAMDLASSSGLSSDSRRLKPDSGHEAQERLRCYWSIVLLKNLYGSHASTVTFVHDEKTPSLPESPRPPAGLSSLMTDAALEQPETTNSASGPSDLGIVAYVIQLSEIWQKSARYAHRRGKVGGLPPWSAQSDHAQITAELMDSETRLPYKYRFRPAKFAEQDPRQLQEHHEFWASWILLQMLYHTVLCLLNHPLLLSLRLRNFRVTMVPEVFLQHTADLTATHTEWIVHLLDVCERKEFELYNPFLAHSAAIAATIYLQQSYSENSAIRSTKQECFRKCVAFIKRLGSYWPYIEQLALKIERFEQVVSASYREPTSQHVPNDRVFIDLDLFWEIIESSFVTELPRTTKSYFGASLASHRQLIHSEEVLRSRLLPEPTRIGSDVSRRDDNADPAPAIQLPTLAAGPSNPTPDLLPPENGEASILAQNYFALGEDLVGNLDDWWFPRQYA
ncbi:putative C6 transcription factor [Cladophialophora carrionii]|uniref:Putative C6 transcription factor n=1 Tax=Cladophialophora carrionii TaxID=86049 RepID=A0A1C1CU73_9EURO|nr:putative C6 transcription factor [Cladophialophora carrionii]